MKAITDKPVITKTKRVEWAYPTSTNAVKFGFGKVGCWVVQTIERSGSWFVWPPKALKGFASKDDARAHGETLSCEWDRLAY